MPVYSHILHVCLHVLPVCSACLDLCVVCDRSITSRTCSQADVLAHIGIILCLLRSNFGVGPHLPHELLHTIEHTGIFIAIVATLAAACGEILSLTKAKHMQDDAAVEEHDATQPVRSLGPPNGTTTVTWYTPVLNKSKRSPIPVPTC
eukprot:353069-Chlamydomonas_euryale.AAC.25